MFWTELKPAAASVCCGWHTEVSKCIKHSVKRRTSCASEWHRRFFAMTLPLIPVSGTFETLVEKVRTTAFAGANCPVFLFLWSTSLQLLQRRFNRQPFYVCTVVFVCLFLFCFCLFVCCCSLSPVLSDGGFSVFVLFLFVCLLWFVCFSCFFFFASAFWWRSWCDLVEPVQVLRSLGHYLRPTKPRTSHHRSPGGPLRGVERGSARRSLKGLTERAIVNQANIGTF